MLCTIGLYIRPELTTYEGMSNVLYISYICIHKSQNETTIHYAHIRIYASTYNNNCCPRGYIREHVCVNTFILCELDTSELHFQEINLNVNQVLIYDELEHFRLVRRQINCHRPYLVIYFITFNTYVLM